MELPAQNGKGFRIAPFRICKPILDKLCPVCALVPENTFQLHHRRPSPAQRHTKGAGGLPRAPPACTPAEAQASVPRPTACGGMAYRMRGAEYPPAPQCRPMPARPPGFSRRWRKGAPARTRACGGGRRLPAQAPVQGRSVLPPLFHKFFSAGRPVPCGSLLGRPCGTLRAEGPAFSYSV